MPIAHPSHKNAINYSGAENDATEDSRLLLNMKAGDGGAFDKLYEKYWRKIYASAYKRLQNMEQAKDITQDIFLQLWLKREITAIENLPAYLYTAVRNKVFNLLEKENRYVPVPELLLNLETAHEQADAIILKKEFAAACNALIATLTKAQQKIFRLHYQQYFSTKEIAESLNISRKTVQNQLGKAIIQLRDQ